MKVLLIDDHPLMLQALQTVVLGLGSNVEVEGVNTAARAREVLGTAPSADLVLMDLGLDDADGFELLAELRASHPTIPVVVVSASERGGDVIRAIDLGAMGFVPKRANSQTLLDALQMVLNGGLYVPPMSLGGPDISTPPAPNTMSVSTASLAKIGLTPRQKDVLGCLLQGKSNKLIARELNLSVETVKDHVAAVLRALGVSSRTQAVLAVSQLAYPGGDAVPAWRAALAA